jgi:hypothetical protein
MRVINQHILPAPPPAQTIVANYGSFPSAYWTLYWYGTMLAHEPNCCQIYSQSSSHAVHALNRQIEVYFGSLTHQLKSPTQPKNNDG